MIVPADQIEFKKKIGQSRGSGIYHTKLKGGLHLVSKASGEVLGMGPHRLVARHIALRQDPDIVFSELSKGDHYGIEEFEHLLPEYEEATRRLRALQAGAASEE